MIRFLENLNKNRIKIEYVMILYIPCVLVEILMYYFIFSFYFFVLTISCTWIVYVSAFNVMLINVYNIYSTYINDILIYIFQHKLYLCVLYDI